MRDARLLVWVLAEPTRAAQLSAAQWQAIARIASAEGLATVLCARVSAADVPPDVQAVLETRKACPEAPLPTICAAPDDICRAISALLASDLGTFGLLRLWHIDASLRQGAAAPDFWAQLVAAARAQGVTAQVSRALRLCHHLFETPVDRYLAWQGQRSDVLYTGILLARNGQGKATAAWLRRAFRLRARWRRRRA